MYMPPAERELTISSARAAEARVGRDRVDEPVGAQLARVAPGEVDIVQEPTEMPYGIDAAIRDPSGEKTGLNLMRLSRVSCTGSPLGSIFT